MDQDDDDIDDVIDKKEACGLHIGGHCIKGDTAYRGTLLIGGHWI